MEQTTHSEYLLRIWREYELRLDDIRHQLDGIQSQLPLTKRLLHFEQIQAAFVIFKVEKFYFSSTLKICFEIVVGFKTTFGCY
jgi:hypothetical protein